MVLQSPQPEALTFDPTGEDTQRRPFTLAEDAASAVLLFRDHYVNNWPDVTFLLQGVTETHVVAFEASDKGGVILHYDCLVDMAEYNASLARHGTPLRPLRITLAADDNTGYQQNPTGDTILQLGLGTTVMCGPSFPLPVVSRTIPGHTEPEQSYVYPIDEHGQPYFPQKPLTIRLPKIPNKKPESQHARAGAREKLLRILHLYSDRSAA